MRRTHEPRKLRPQRPSSSHTLNSSREARCRPPARKCNSSFRRGEFCRRNERGIALCCGSAPAHTRARISVDVRVRSSETVVERLQESDNLVLLRIRQVELTDRHVLVLRHLRGRPASYPLDGPCRAVSGFHFHAINVPGVIEVNELLEALDVTVVEELLLEVGPRRFGGWTLWRRQSHIACGTGLHSAIGRLCEWYPGGVRVGSGAETAAQESSQSQIGVCKTSRIGRKSQGVRGALIIKGVPGILGQSEVGIAETREQWRGGCGCAGVYAVRRRPFRRRRCGCSGPAIEMAGVAIRFAAEELVTGHLLGRERIFAGQERVKLG